MKILVIEDDKQLIQYIKKGLVQAGFSVETALDGASGLYLAMETAPDLVIVDIMLPVLDGYTVIDRIRSQKPGLPILILSAKRTLEDKLKGFEMGTDDYLTKPFSFSELLARVRALLRRSRHEFENPRLICGELEIDPMTRKVFKAGEEIELLPKEYALLEYLVRNKGRVLTRIQILEKIWGYSFDPESNVVDVHICKLREKLGLPKKDGMIRTIRGAGYMIRDED